MAWKFERVAGPFEGAAGGIVWDGEPSSSPRSWKAVCCASIPAGGGVDGVPPLHQPDQRAGARPARRALRLPGRQPPAHRVECRRLAPCRSTRTLDGQRINFPSDLAVDRQGRIWFTDPHHHLPSHSGRRSFRSCRHASVLRLDRHRVTHDWIVERLTFDTAAPRCRRAFGRRADALCRRRRCRARRRARVARLSGR